MSVRIQVYPARKFENLQNKNGASLAQQLENWRTRLYGCEVAERNVMRNLDLYPGHAAANEQMERWDELHAYIVEAKKEIKLYETALQSLNGGFLQRKQYYPFL